MNNLNTRSRIISMECDRFTQPLLTRVASRSNKPAPLKGVVLVERPVTDLSVSDNVRVEVGALDKA